MLIKQDDIEQELDGHHITMMLKKWSSHSTSGSELMAVNQGVNQILIRNMEAKVYQVVELDVAKRGEQMRITRYDVLRTYRTNNMQDVDASAYPPGGATEDSLNYVDAVTHLLMVSYPDAEWVHTIHAVDPVNKTILWDDTTLGMIVESSIAITNSGDLVIWGMPQVYWDQMVPKAY